MKEGFDDNAIFYFLLNSKLQSWYGNIWIVLLRNNNIIFYCGYCDFTGNIDKD